MLVDAFALGLLSLRYTAQGAGNVGRRPLGTHDVVN
jgi:hypothetical protein